MATHTGTGATSLVQPREGLGITSVQKAFTFGGATASAGDVVQMVKVPSGATVITAYVGGGPIAASGCSITVGDGNDANRYLDTTSASSAMTLTHCNALAGANYTYTADDTIDVSITAITSATTTGTFYLNVVYTMDA